MNGTLNIISFLEQVNYAQQVVALSEHEFREMLLRCFTRTPYLYLEEFIKNGMSTSDIYMSLISLYDSRLSPETAKADLSELKCTKTKNIKTNKIFRQTSLKAKIWLSYLLI